VRVEDSIILDGSKVGWQSEIKDSVISRECQIEEDVKIISSIVGDNMSVKIHSRLEHANVVPPTNNNQKA